MMHWLCIFCIFCIFWSGLIITWRHDAMTTQCQNCPKVFASLAKFCQSGAQVIHKLLTRTGVIWKSGCCCWVTGRSGWLLELLTELKSVVLYGNDVFVSSSSKIWQSLRIKVVLPFGSQEKQLIWSRQKKELVAVNKAQLQATIHHSVSYEEW